jgi:uncharacterized GH25 family protein
VVDEQGKPVAKMRMAFHRQPNTLYVGRFTTDAKGAFSMPMPAAGTVEFLVDTGRWLEVADWEVVSPQTLVVPSTDPVTITVRPAAKGRVVTPQGAPVAGVRLNLAFKRTMTDAANHQSTRANWLSVTTNDRGEYALPAYLSGDTLHITEVIRPVCTRSPSERCPKPITAGTPTTR